MAYRVSQPLATSPIIDPDEYETKDERRNRRRKRYIKSTTSKKPAATRAAKEVKTKGPKSLTTRTTTKPKKKRTVVKYTDKDGSKVKSVERGSGKLIETRKKRGGKYSTYKSKKITDKKGNVKVKTRKTY
jgi:hypothetical protein